ncbi:MAG: hypothetical protein KDK45_19600, partial [Leptospiraceae bacterium]|nr:hypothetical protein [Leptospiraceae bacterium]
EEERKKNLIELINKKKESLTDLDVLYTAKDWFLQNVQLEMSSQNEEGALKNFKSKKDRLEQKFQEVLYSIGKPDILEKAIALNTLQEYITKEENLLKNKLQACETEIAELELQKELKNLVHTLEDGKACPVCGSLDHPSPINLEKKEIEEKLEILKEEQFSIKEKQDLLKSAETKALSFWEEKRELEKEIKAKEGEYKLSSKKLEEHKKLFQWEIFKDFGKDQFDRSIQKERNLRNEIEAEEKQLETLIESLEEDRKEIRDKKEEVILLKAELRSIYSNINELEKTFQYLKLDRVAEKTIEDLVYKKRQLEDEKDNLEKDYQATTEALHSINSSLLRKEGIFQQKESQRLEQAELINESYKTLQIELEKSSYIITRVKEILSSIISIESEEEKLKKYKESKSKLEHRIQEITNEYDFSSYSGELYLLKETKLIELKESLNQLRTELGRMKQEERNLKENLSKIEELTLLKKKLEVREIDLLELRSLFIGKGFVNYVSGLYLRNICEIANTRFYRLSGQCLKLELNENNEFLVRDFLNGGKLRSVKTLSGGQFFQASLCLALALSEHLRSLYGDSGRFFFIDEGFGSLDKQSLSVVFETLRSLWKEGKIVGIISHVEEMQNDIHTFIRVVKKEKEGSVIYNSWE